jgi:two-component system, sensor histidine kinase and response regulator
MKVLIAEDQSTSRLLLEAWVREWGAEPVSFTNGAEAWQALQADKDPPRLALLDWIMPEMDGIDLCRRIRASKTLPFIYVIMLTSKKSTEDLITGLDAGADDFASKPVRPEELHSRINVGQRILNYQQRLEELDEQKNRFLGMVAHDLRNPLSSILGFSQILLDDDLEEVRRREFLSIIHRAGEDMMNTLNDLLDISMIESGKLELHCKATDLAELINYHVYLNQVNARRKSIEIEVDAPPALAVFCDAGRIAQVLDNLLSNALKYSPPGTLVRISLRPHGDGGVEVAVQDQGPGVALEKQPRLFGAFAKLGTRPTGGEKSTGLGLAIVKKIVQAHGGTVGVNSAEGQGSRFYFILPGTVQQTE